MKYKILSLTNETYQKLKERAFNTYNDFKKNTKFVEKLLNNYEFNENDFKKYEKRRYIPKLSEKAIKKLEYIQKRTKGKGITTEEIIKVLMQKLN